MYTNEKNLSIDDLTRLKDKFNSSTDFSDRGYMNELFNGLESIIDKVKRYSEICRIIEQGEYEFHTEVGGYIDLEDLEKIINK
jgi:hypothetical protein